MLPETSAAPAFPVVVNPCLLPADPSRPGFQRFDDTVTVVSTTDVLAEATCHAAVPASTLPCAAPPRASR